MEKIPINKQSFKFQAFYNNLEIKNGELTIVNLQGILIKPTSISVEPNTIKNNLVCKPKDRSNIEEDLYKGIYYTNILDYTLGEISFAANLLTDSWVKNIWSLLIEEKENCHTVSLTDESIKEQLLVANPELFENEDDIDNFLVKYNLKLDDFILIGKYEQIEISLATVAARLSSEIIFFRKKLFTELFIQKLDAEIYNNFANLNLSLSKNRKEIYLRWRESQIRDLNLVQKYIKSPFTFEDLEQFSNYRSLNEFAVNSNNGDLIAETLYWIETFPKAKKRFEIAIDYLTTKKDLRDSVDNLRLSLELLLKDLLENNKSLENQLTIISSYQESLGISKEIRNTFEKTLDYFNKYQNNRVKHNDEIGNIHEVEFIFGLTMIFIRLLVKPNPKFQLQ